MSSDVSTWVHASMRQSTAKAREEGRDSLVLQRRRCSDDDEDDDQGLLRQIRAKPTSLVELLPRLKAARYTDRALLADLKQVLADGADAETLFRFDGALPALVGVLTLASSTTTSSQDASLPPLAAQCIANLCPLTEKYGLQLARSAGPYLVTLLSSGSAALREASAVALGNLALAGAKVVNVLVNQEAVESLVALLESRSSPESLQSAAFYALYHILHAGARVDAHLLVNVAGHCRRLMSVKAPVELHWVYFVLSGQPGLHTQLVDEATVRQALDICTYEIFQKSDSRPLVKIVTPVVRYLANFCAGPRGEAACLLVLRHPDLQAILTALLATNYTHLCQETLWLFSNIVNSDSVVVQEELIELDLMDRLEYHTVQAVQKMDPYLTNSIIK